MNTGPVIGVDWGSTNVRVFRFDADGGVRDVRRAQSGAGALRGEAFEGALRTLANGWLEADAARIVICGMAGAREGWAEAAYARCPCDLRTLADSLIRPPSGLDVWIVPGVATLRDNGRVDVMRGEETQILGALENQAGPALVIAPGTHSKWVQIEDGRLTDFHSHLTGELFALLRSHSVLGRTMASDAPHDAAAFDLGARRALEDQGLLNLIFSARAEILFERLTPDTAASYLSGVLIGAEVAEASARTGAGEQAPVFLVGEADLVSRYERALALAGLAPTRALDGESAAARGLWRIAQELDA